MPDDRTIRERLTALRGLYLDALEKDARLGTFLPGMEGQYGTPLKPSYAVDHGRFEWSQWRVDLVSCVRELTDVLASLERGQGNRVG